jgi:hypothetical protein
VALELNSSVRRWKRRDVAHPLLVVLSIRVGAVLPGTPTWPDLIVDHRHLYEDALDTADDAWQAGKVDVSKMEGLLESLLAQQLAKIDELAGGKIGTG